jgi:rubrerythrin
VARDGSPEGGGHGGEVCFRQGRQVRWTGRGDADDLAAVRQAIDFEAKGSAFYADLRDKSADPKEKAFFALLASIEHEHFSSLKDTEEYFVDPGAWFQKHEKTLLDGA